VWVQLKWEVTKKYIQDFRYGKTENCCLFWTFSIAWTLGKVQKPRNSECDTPSSEPFRIYMERPVNEILDKVTQADCRPLVYIML
jgi:hypothetical protein